MATRNQARRPRRRHDPAPADVRAAIMAADAQAEAAAIERAQLAGASAMFGALIELSWRRRARGDAAARWNGTATAPPAYQC